VLAITPNEKLVGEKLDNGLGKTRESGVKTRMQKKLDGMADDSALLAMALDDMEFLGLIKWKPDADKEATIDEKREAHGDRQASTGLVLAERYLRASFTERRSLADQVRQLLEQAAPKVEPSR
jgi:hypothetical protein